jgi:hypothetical protein
MRLLCLRIIVLYSDYFLRNRENSSWLRKCSAFYAILKYIPLSKEPTAGPYPEPDESSPHSQVSFL